MSSSFVIYDFDVAILWDASWDFKMVDCWVCDDGLSVWFVV